MGDARSGWLALAALVPIGCAGSRSASAPEIALRRAPIGVTQAHEATPARAVPATDASAAPGPDSRGRKEGPPTPTPAPTPTHGDRLRTACDAGDHDACNQLGVWLENNGGAAVESYALYERACARDVVIACSNQGSYLSRGLAVPIDTRRAAQLFGKACDAGISGACARLGDAHEAGAGVPKDLPKAQALFVRACALGDGDACSDRGYYLETTRHDIEEAVKSYDRACRLASARGCHNLGVTFEEGRGVVASSGRAAELFREACRLGKKSDCKR